jgi:predicted DNA-binding mobile mystery protein A
MRKTSLQFQQLSKKMSQFSSLKQVIPPPAGWIKAIRTTLGMSMQQLGNRLGITKQAVLDIERREKEGSITIKSLSEIARAMDMQLVYGFVPNDENLDALVEKRANELAKIIVMRTSSTMKLEDQANSENRIQTAIQERTEELINELPKILWD